MRSRYIVLGLLILIFIGLGCVGNKQVGTGDNTTPGLLSQTPNVTQDSGNISKGSATLSSPDSSNATGTTKATIKCELCHTSPETISVHVNGGKLCINCHGSQVHNIHIGEGTVNLDCKTCHGMPPTIPTVKNGTGPGHYIVCENCHAPPPNSLNASNGNLIVIHLSRGKYCTNCHGSDVGKIHEAVLNKTRKP